MFLDVCFLGVKYKLLKRKASFFRGYRDRSTGRRPNQGPRNAQTVHGTLRLVAGVSRRLYYGLPRPPAAFPGAFSWPTLSGGACIHERHIGIPARNHNRCNFVCFFVLPETWTSLTSRGRREMPSRSSKRGHCALPPLTSTSLARASSTHGKSGFHPPPALFPTLTHLFGRTALPAGPGATFFANGLPSMDCLCCKGNRAAVVLLGASRQARTLYVEYHRRLVLFDDGVKWESLLFARSCGDRLAGSGQH